MKTSITKQLLMAFLCCLSFTMMNAQDVEGDDPAPGVTITPDPALSAEFQPVATVPKIKASSVIAYADGLSLSLEFEGEMIPRTVLFVDKNNSSDSRTLQVTGGNSSLFGVTAGKVYDVKATGSDGRLYIIGSVNTAPYKAGDPVIVSQNLYRALSLYVANSTQSLTLSNYLKQLSNVSQHENISFLQRYAMNGAVLPGSVKGQYPDAYVRQALEVRRPEGECMCNFVMNQVTVVVPDENGVNNFSIGAKTFAKGPDFYNQASYTYRAKTAQGPAVHQLLHSAGKQAGNKRRTEVWASGAENFSDNSVKIGYHLMCIGINELPKDCECAKQVKYDFNYSTRTEAKTKTGGFGCIFEQEAGAQAQDWAVAFVTRENVNNVSDVQIFHSGSAVATSSCKGGVPVNVVVDVLKIGVNVFEMIKDIKTGNLTNINALTNEIIDKLGAVLEKVTEVKDCGNALIEKPLISGNTTITFKPNDPLTFVIISGSNMSIVGRRCWESEARIKSSFSLAGVILGGSPSASTTHCCTDYFANWAYASQKGDATSCQNKIASHLALNSPGGWQVINGNANPGGTITIPTEIGYAIGANLPNGQKCNKEIPINLNPH